MYKIINTKKELQELANEMGICPDHHKHLFDFRVIVSRSASSVNIYNKYDRRVAIVSLKDLFLFACNISEIDQPQS